MSITVEPLDDAKAKVEETKLAVALAGLAIDFANRGEAAERLSRYAAFAHAQTIKEGRDRGLDYTPEFEAQAKAVCDRAVARALDFVFPETSR